MPELRFATAQPKKSVCSIHGQLTQVLATLAILAEESLIQESIQTPSQPLSGWITKPALSV